MSLTSLNNHVITSFVSPPYSITDWCSMVAAMTAPDWLINWIGVVMETGSVAIGTVTPTLETGMVMLARAVWASRVCVNSGCEVIWVVVYTVGALWLACCGLGSGVVTLLMVAIAFRVEFCRTVLAMVGERLSCGRYTRVPVMVGVVGGVCRVSSSLGGWCVMLWFRNPSAVL